MVKVVNHNGASKVSSKKASPIKKGKTTQKKVVLSKKNGKKTATKVTKKAVKKTAAQPKQMWDFFAEDAKYKKL